MTKKFSFILTVSLATLSLSTCDPGRESAAQENGCSGYTLADKEAIVPPWPAKRPAPRNLDESLGALDEWLTEPQKQYYRCTDFSVVLTQVHFGLARWIRDNWNLYSPDPLREYLLSIGLRHQDGMSNLIALQYIYKLRGTAFDSKEFVQQSREYWERADAARKNQGGVP